MYLIPTMVPTTVVTRVVPLRAVPALADRPGVGDTIAVLALVAIVALAMAHRPTLGRATAWHWFRALQA